MPKVSVVIPCYNQGEYLDESIQSVLDQTYQDYEIIVVDDGSDDLNTKKLLASFNQPKTRIVHTENVGLARARNNGIRTATGEYILPLDADDKIGNEYLEAAVNILDKHSDIGIVYCQAAYFGDRDGLVDLPEFSTERILRKNIIFCSAFFRKKHWEAVGGYKDNMVYGLEDWDFWLSLLELNLRVYRIPKTLFFYRIRKASMRNTMKDEEQFFMIKNVIFNHRQLYRDCAEIYIVPKVAEIYIDTGLGFNSNQVISKVVFRDEKAIEFDLSSYQDIKGIRFDPLNDYCVVHVQKVEVEDNNGTLFEIQGASSNAEFKEESNFIFATKDPQIYFDNTPNDINKLRVYMEYISIGKDAYDYIFKYQRNIIGNQRNHIRQLHDEKNRIPKLVGDIENLQKKLKFVEDQYNDIIDSTAWKLTFPIRWIFNRFNQTTGDVLRNQKTNFINEVLFLYHCYLKKDKNPPQRYNFVGGEDFPGIGKLYFDAIVKYCDVRQNDALLDVGCGIGRVAFHFIDYLSTDGIYEGFDIVKKGIRWCSHKITRHHPNFNFIHADIYNKEYNPKGKIDAKEFVFPYPANHFDVVFATSVFTHMLPDAIIRYLNEIYRVLKPEKGRTLISAFILNRVSKECMKRSDFNFKKIDERYGVMLEENPEAAIAYEEVYIRKIFKNAGLKIVEPIRYGTWSTRDSEIHGQDLIIARKE